jgi:hypothetical protein
MSESSLAFPRGEVVRTRAQNSVRRFSRSLEWIVGSSARAAWHSSRLKRAWVQLSSHLSASKVLSVSKLCKISRRIRFTNKVH